MRNPNCTLCPLHETAQNVCIWGSGPEQASLVIVGMNPGAEENKLGKAFVGSSGKLLNSLLERAGIKREEVYITNGVKCHTPKNREPSIKEANACRPYLLEELSSIKPKFVVALGNFALRMLSGSGGISRKRGVPTPLASHYGLSDTRIIPTFHPAAALRNPSYESQIVADLAFARSLVDGTAAQITATNIVRVDGRNKAEALAAIAEAEVLAYDIETNARDFVDPEYGVYCLGVDTGTTTYIFERKSIPADIEGVPVEVREDLVGSGVEALSAFRGSIVGHNSVRFDAPGLLKYGADLQDKTEDNMLLAYLQDENAQSYNLESCAHRIIGAGEWKDMVKWDWKDEESIPWDTMLEYNAKDCRTTWLLFERLNSVLSDEGMRRVYYHFLKPSVAVLSEISGNGIYVRETARKSAEIELGKQRDEAEAALKEIAGEKFNPASVKQVKEQLYDTLGFSPILSHEGKVTTDELALKTLQQNAQGVGLEFISHLLEYREASKLLGTYISAYAEIVDAGGRIYPSYSLTNTVTGRTSCFKPNLQNVPRDKRLRAMIGAPEGRVFMQADYSQLELRMAAHVANEENLRQAFVDGKDLHRLTASAVTGKPYDEVTDTERTEMGKVPNFALLYCAEESTLIDYAFKTYGLKFTFAQARKIRNNFYAAWPGLTRWYGECAESIKRDGEIRSITGQIRRLPGIHATADNLKVEALRMGINFCVQNPAAHFALAAMVELNQRLRSVAPSAFLTGFIHDAVTLEAEPNDVEPITALIKEVFEVYVPKFMDSIGVPFSVPLVADVSVGSSWADK